MFLDFLGFWIFGYLDFFVLHLCFQSVETAPKLDSEKTAFVSVFTVFLRGVRVVGGVTICIYICMYTYMCAYMYMSLYIFCMCVYVWVCVSIYIHVNVGKSRHVAKIR